MIRALVTVDSTPSHWGGDPVDAAVTQRAAELLAERIADAILERYPEAEVEYQAHDYLDGESTRLVDLSGDYTIEQYEEITTLAGTVSEDGWEEALYDATPRRPGRPAGPPTSRVTLTLPVDVAEWLRAQENMSATVAGLVRTRNAAAELEEANRGLQGVQVLLDGLRFAVTYKRRGSWVMARVGGGIGTGTTPSEALTGAYYDGGRPMLHDTLAEALAEANLVVDASDQ